MFIGSGIVALLVHALHPAWWAVFYQLPIAFGMAWIIARQQARQEIPRSNIINLAAITGIGGPLLFFFLISVFPGLLTGLLSIAGMWMGTSFGLDKYLDVDWESSQRITGAICVPIWIVWLIIGAVLYVLQ